MNRSNLNTGLAGSKASRGEQHVPGRDIGLQDGRLGPWCGNRTAIAGGVLPGKKLHCISGNEEIAVCWQHGRERNESRFGFRYRWGAEAGGHESRSGFRYMGA